MKHAPHPSLPAILFGGPPHSGKSVLIYSVSQALRRRGVPHYVLRACPDGEGDWANESDQTLVQTIRDKGDFTPNFMAEMVSYLQKRQMPLLVDVGGKPRPWQETIFTHCTHAVLLIRADAPHAPQEWTERLTRHNLPLIAQLTSQLQGENSVTSHDPLTGLITQLERGQQAQGASFTALVNLLEQILTQPAQQASRQHQQQLAAAWHFVDVGNMPAELGRMDGRWQPADLPPLLRRLPADQPIALYGRAPVWVYTCAARHTHAAPFQQFDSRLGWIRPPTLTLGDLAPAQAAPSFWQTRWDNWHGLPLLELQLASQLLDLETAHHLPLPPIPTDQPLIISGKLPLWFSTALARQLAHLPLLAFFQPQVGAVVIHATDSAYPVGHVLPS